MNDMTPKSPTIIDALRNVDESERKQFDHLLAVSINAMEQGMKRHGRTEWTAEDARRLVLLYAGLVDVPPVQANFSSASVASRDAAPRTSLIDSMQRAVDGLNRENAE